MWYALYKYIKMAVTSSEIKSSKNVHKIISVKTLNISLQKLMIFFCLIGFPSQFVNHDFQFAPNFVDSRFLKHSFHMNCVHFLFFLWKCVSEDDGDATDVFSANVYGAEAISKAMDEQGIILESRFVSAEKGVAACF